MGLKRYRETVVCFEKSKEILGRVPDFEQLVAQLAIEIENLREKIEDEEEDGNEGEVQGDGEHREKKVKANEDSSMTTYIIIGTVSALVLGAAFAMMRYRRS